MLTLTRPETRRIVGHFSDEFQERILNRILVQQINEAVRAGLMPAPMGGSALGFYITNAEAISMLTDHGVGLDAGTAAVIQIYAANVGVPADADAANTNTLLATLTCSATAFTSVADDTPGAIATFAAITQDSSADATATAAFFRISTQSGGTVTDQGTVGTATADLILNTTAITSGSAVSITAATILLPEGP